MNNAVFNNWKHLRGEINSVWEHISETDLIGIDGQRDSLVTLLSDRYGLIRSRAEREVDLIVSTFEEKLKNAA